MADSRSTSTSADLLGGRYRVGSEIARGGTATVHRGHDTVLDRAVAIKILHPHLARDETFLDRFRREARAAAALSHPNVVAVHDWGESDGGAYLVMELVEGMSLRDVLRMRGRLTPREVLALIGPVAAGLAAAHDRELVHRDVKPENVLLSHEGTVKLADFGLARAVATSTQTFGADALVGSPHYLAPEAVAGGTLDARTDVYSLGIVIYEAIVGEPPFQGDSALATAMQHTAREVPRPSHRIPGTPPALDTVVFTATAPDPVERYLDAYELGVALAQAVPEGPIAVDLRDGRNHTVILPSAQADTEIPAPRPRRRPEGGGVQAPPPPRRLRIRWGRLVAAVAALGVVAAAVWSFVIAPVRDLPVVLGQSSDAARAALEEAGFNVRIAPLHEYSTDTPDGAVVAAEPPTAARRGTTVTLTLSAGPRPVEIPEVLGTDAQTAQEILGQAGLVPEIDEVFHETVPTGIVVGTDPAVFVVARAGDTVRVLVSAGREPITLPNLVNAPADDVTASLEELGLQVVVIEEVNDNDIPDGWVVTQSPVPGTVLHRGDQVQLTVSLGPKRFQMPDVRGMTEEEAVAALEELDLDVTVEYVNSFFRPDGIVAEQDPSPGKRVRGGDEVTIFVWA